MMNDEQAITQLVHGLAFALDEADGASIEALMADCSFTLGDFPPVVGGAAYRRLIEHGMILHDGSPRTHHVITNLVVTVADDGETATSRSYVSVLQQTDELPLQVVLGGRYADAFDRDERGAWRFAVRLMTIVQRGDTSQHSIHQM